MTEQQNPASSALVPVPASAPADSAPQVLTDAQKLDYVYRQAVRMDELVTAAEPLLAQAGPMLDSVGPLVAQFAGQASSPMGRIFGSMIR